jgi:hypothetical protein
MCLISGLGKLVAEDLHGSTSCKLAVETDTREP